MKKYEINRYSQISIQKLKKLIFFKIKQNNNRKIYYNFFLISNLLFKIYLSLNRIKLL